jgi:hypothetical protein
MRAPFTLGLALVLVAGALSGCGTKDDLTRPASTGSGGMEEAEVSNVLASTPELIEDQVYEDPSEYSLGATSEGATLIHPLRFWRVITDVSRRYTFAFADTDTTGRPTTALVGVHKFLRGRFNVLAGPFVVDAVSDTDSVQVVRKPLADHWRRNVLLKRVPFANSRHTAWRVAATSGVQVTSFDPAGSSDPPAYGETRIVSLRVQAGPLDTTITDPLQLFRLRRVIQVDAATPVILTATTLRNDDVVVMMWRGLKFRFRNNGDNTYTGKWMAPLFRGVGHFGVNALSNGTLFDDQEPYDSQAWILPYLVRPHVLDEYLP